MIPELEHLNHFPSCGQHNELFSRTHFIAATIFFFRKVSRTVFAIQPAHARKRDKATPRGCTTSVFTSYNAPFTLRF